MTSRFKEILELKQEISRLTQDNEYLREQFVKIDEFRLAMNKEANL